MLLKGLQEEKDAKEKELLDLQKFVNETKSKVCTVVVCRFDCKCTLVYDCIAISRQ